MIESLCVLSLIIGMIAVIYGIVTYLFHIEGEDEDEG